MNNLRLKSHRVVKAALTAVAAVVLANAGSAAAQPNELGFGARRIAVVVWAGHELKLQRMGFMVFGNQYGKVPERGDRLAAALYAAVEHELNLEQRYDVRRVPTAPTELPRLSERAHEGSTRFWAASIEDLGNEIDRLRADCRCDALLVVAEARAEVPGTNQFFRGITLFRNASDKASLAAPLVLYLVDPATGKTVAKSGANVLYRASTDAGWAGKAEEVHTLDDAAWAAVTDGLRRTLQSSLPEALDRLGLRPSCSRFFYEWTTQPNQREPASERYVPPPRIPEGADPSRCTAPGAAGFKPQGR
jgi:hypothetical protein